MSTSLGVGVVWWPELDALCRPGEGLVHVIEAEPETFWIPRGGPDAGFTSRLPQALGHLSAPKLLHGVGAPFGGASAQSDAHLATLSGDIEAVRPAWISDHLCFNRFTRAGAGGSDQSVSAGFLLPPAQCRAGVTQAAEHIKTRRAATGVPVAFENLVSYLPPLPGEMPDGDFVAAVAEAADCGILLDLHNLLCNERNGRQSVAEFCRSIPLDRVWEIHLAGGQEQRGFWLDSHSGLVEPELMRIVTELVPRLPALGAIIFEIVPDFIAATGVAAIGTLLGQLNDIWAARPQAGPPDTGRPRAAGIDAAASTISPAIWENAIGATVTGLDGPELPPLFADWADSAEAPLQLYKYLAQEGRACSLVFTAPLTIRSLLSALGEAETRQLLARFWHGAAPGYTSAEEGRTFLNYLADADIPVPGLRADIAADLIALR